MDSEAISFGRFRLDIARRELLRDGEPVKLYGRALDILCALAAAKGEVVGKDALLARVWPGRIVEEGNIHVHVSALRKALDEQGAGHSYVVTVPGRGYRLASLAGSPEAVPFAARRPPFRDKPSIAVMPFANLSDDLEQEYFADGVVEEIVVALSRIRWLFVIARNSTATYKGQPVDLKQVGRELRVRYVLQGSVRRAGGSVRLTTQLTDAGTAENLWADRFDGSLDDLLEFQHAIATAVAGVLEPSLESAEICRSVGLPSAALTAHDLYLRARRLRASFEREQMLRAIELCMQAVERDPAFGAAISFAAMCRLDLHYNGWIDDEELNRKEALSLGRRALRITADDPRVLSEVALILSHFGDDITISTSLIERGLALNPSYARAWNISGVIRLAEGRTDLAVENFAKSARLDPRDRIQKWSQLGIGEANFFEQRFEEATVSLKLALEYLPNFATIHRFLAASYAHMGRLAEAKEVLERLRIITDRILPATIPYRKPEHRKLYLSGLRLAAGQTEQ